MPFLFSFLFNFFFFFPSSDLDIPHSPITWFPDISQVLWECSTCLAEGGSWGKGQWGRAMHRNSKYLCIKWANKITGRDWSWHTELINSTNCFKSLINWFIWCFPVHSKQHRLPWKLLDTREDIHLSAEEFDILQLTLPCICCLLFFGTSAWTVLMHPGVAPGEGAGGEQSCHSDKASIRKRQEKTSAILISTIFDGARWFLWIAGLAACLCLFIYLFAYCEWGLWYCRNENVFFLKGWSRRRKYLRTSYLFSLFILYWIKLIFWFRDGATEEF